MGRRKKKSKQTFLDSTVETKPISKEYVNLPKPRFLVLSKDHPFETMADVPSSLLTNVINNVAGKVNAIKKQRNGTVLIETKTETQSTKLMKLRYFPPKVPVRVTAHRWLNYSRGVVKCYDLGKNTLEDMKSELRSQFVVDIKPIMSKSLGKDGKCTLEKYVSYILTFSLPKLPKVVTIGYVSANLIPYVPHPKMCYRCLHYGHIKKDCPIEETVCSKCVEPGHDTENCSSPTQVCANCSQGFQTGHNSCLGYMVHRKIMEIDSILKNLNFDE